MPPSTKPSSNWLALQKTLVRHDPPRKRPKIDRGEPDASRANSTPSSARGIPSPPPKRHLSDDPNEHIDLETVEVKNGESIAALRRMVLGKVGYQTPQTALGKYLALDCEMVGVGIEGNESSLARVSIVNYVGATILDAFVRQRERVVDYRTQFSGVRSTDLAGSAKPFREVQQTVADLIKDRILVGHAVYNDLKALLLSHPSPQLRDTQSLAYKHRVVKSRRPALRVLVKQELGIVIQGGEHSSVTDARATMALFRLHKKQWESGFRPIRTSACPPSESKADADSAGKTIAPAPSSSTSVNPGRKRQRTGFPESDGDGVNERLSSQPQAHALSPSNALHTRSPTQHIPTSTKHRKQVSRRQPPAESAQRKGISSGISTVTSRAGGIKEVRRKGNRVVDGGQKGEVVEREWWKDLEGDKKGRIRL